MCTWFVLLLDSVSAEKNHGIFFNYLVFFTQQYNLAVMLDATELTVVPKRHIKLFEILML